MKTWKNKTRRGLASFLALVMCLSLLQIPAFAADTDAPAAEVPQTPENSVVEKPAESDESAEEEPSEEEPADSDEPQQGTISNDANGNVIVVPPTPSTDESNQETIITVEDVDVMPPTPSTDEPEKGTIVKDEEGIVTAEPEKGTIIKDEDGNVTAVTPPAEFTAKAENGTEATVTVDENGNAVVTTADGKAINAEVTAKVETEPVKTDVDMSSGQTTKKLVTIQNEDGTTTPGIEYTTTYTQKVTTGYWVTYTVTYEEPVTYSASSKNPLLNVSVDENGAPTISGIGTLTLQGSDGINYPVEANKDGTFYVQIQNTKYEVVPSFTKTAQEGTDYDISWNFAEGNNPKYPVPVALPEGVAIDAETKDVTLTGDVTLNGKQFHTRDGKTYIVDGDKKYEVTLTATGDATNGYALSWSYDVVQDAPEGEAVPVVKLPEKTVVTMKEDEKGKVTITLKDAKGNEIASQSEILGHAITSYSQNENGVVNVYCKDENGATYVYAVGATATQNEGNPAAYELTYQQVTKVEKETKPAEEVFDEVKAALGKNTNNQGEEKECEFIAILLPGNKYINVAQGPGGNNCWLAIGTYPPDVDISVKGNGLTISVDSHFYLEKKKTIEYTFENLDGYDIKDVVYSLNRDENLSYDNLILYISGIVVEDKYGNVQKLTLTAKDDGHGGSTLGSVDPEELHQEGSANVGGTKEETIHVSQLDGSAVVVVKTAGGDTVKMTYWQYLETVVNEPLVLTGVVESSINPSDNPGGGSNPAGGNDSDDGNDPVIPVIPDPDVPPVEDPEVEIPEPDVPLVEDPEVDVSEPDVPLAEEPEQVEVPVEDVPLAQLPQQTKVPAKSAPKGETALVEIEDEDVPLADVPQTGDNTGLWAAVLALSVCGLAILTGKKREDEMA